MYIKLLLTGKRCECKKEDLVSAKEEVKMVKCQFLVLPDILMYQERPYLIMLG